MAFELHSPFGDKLGSRSDVVYRDPRSLLTPKRLDIAVKMAYCKKLDGKPRHLSGVDVDRLYTDHIEARTGGVEPNSIYRKRSTDDYKHFLDRVFQELKEHGFDPAEPIQMSQRTGMILNGAHRLAASVVLGMKEVPVVFDDNNEGREWGMPWFINQGFSRLEQMEIASTFMEYSGEAFNLGIVWPSDLVSSDSVLAALGESSTLFYTDKLAPSKSLAEFIYDTYAYDYGVDVKNRADNIVRKVDRLCAKQSSEAYLVAFSCESIEHAVALRNQLRSQFEPVFDGPDFDVFHCASSLSERDHLNELFFSPTTLASYDYRDCLSENLTKQLLSFSEAIGETEFHRKELCVVGGAVLDLYRYKQCDDIDFVLPYRIRRRHFDDMAHEIAPGVDLASYNYARKLNVGFTWSDDELTRYSDLHTLCRGFRFASLDIVFERKRWSPRPKDKVDVERIARDRHGSQYPAPGPADESFDAMALSKADLLTYCRRFHSEGKLHLAAKAYRALTERFPDDPIGWEGLGICALQRGDNPVARDLFEKSNALGGTPHTDSYLDHLKPR